MPSIGARVLHRCVLAVPPASSLRVRAMASLATLAEAGLDPLTLGGGKLSDVYLTKGPQKPATDKLTVSASASPATTASRTRSSREAPGSGPQPALVACWEAYSAASKKDTLAVTLPIKVGYASSEYEDEAGTWFSKIGPASGLSGAEAEAERCVRQGGGARAQGAQVQRAASIPRSPSRSGRPRAAGVVASGVTQPRPDLCAMTLADAEDSFAVARPGRGSAASRRGAGCTPAARAARGRDDRSRQGRARGVRRGRRDRLARASAEVQTSRDGTRKLRLVTRDGHSIESVLIPDGEKTTQCISSQVGCAVDCQFCATAKLGLERNLDAGEIVDQVYLARRLLAEVEPGRRITNLVYMGMGEPLHNYDNVLTSLRILTDDKGAGLGQRRITVSTSGLVPKLERLGAEDVRPNLAVSLNAPNDAVRDQIMPINRKWNIAKLLGALQAYPLEQRRRITFEYVLLAGVNDSLADAAQLARLLRGIKCKVNVIPCNPHPEAEFQRPSPRRDRRVPAGVQAARAADVPAHAARRRHRRGVRPAREPRRRRAARAAPGSARARRRRRPSSRRGLGPPLPPDGGGACSPADGVGRP